MPQEFVEFGESWRRHHPDWQLILWTEANLPRLRNQAHFDAATSLAQKADIARYELLFEHGGVYLDCDFECLRPIDPLLEGVTCFSATEDERWISIGIMGATPKHPLFEAVVAEIPASLAQGHAKINEQTGPLLLTRVVTRRKMTSGRDEMHVFAPKLFYPYSYGERRLRRHEKFPEAFAVHHWAGSWVVADEAASSAPKPNVAAGPAEAKRDERLRVVVALDPERPDSALALVVAFARTFRKHDPIELAVYAYSEPSLPLLECIQPILIAFLADLPDPADISICSRAELSTFRYQAAFVPTGDQLRDVRALADAMCALAALRAQLDARAGRAPSLPLPTPMLRDELLRAIARGPAPGAAPPPPSVASAGPADVAPHAAAALHGAYLGDGRVLVQTTWGRPVLASSHDLSLTPELLVHGEYDPALARFLQTRLAPGHVAFDVGANIGLFTVLMGQRVGAAGRVIAYEADPQNYALLVDNVSMNYFTDRVTLVARAAWSSEAKLTFHATERFRGNGSVRAKDEHYRAMYPGDSVRTFEVQAESLDHRLREHPQVELVKIDVEGAELQVLSGMDAALRKGALHTVVFECVRELLGADWAALLALLERYQRELGLRCSTLSSDGSLVSLPLATLAARGNFSQVVLERPR
jgi:FkbM family methyltransferase